ncbi:hypothetical protein NIES39_H00310 [Arthrospira platensis NIES-39]|nr:hypothetical protein NIES39_H00310 [Arthrospira platensis NIES-39]
MTISIKHSRSGWLIRFFRTVGGTISSNLLRSSVICILLRLKCSINRVGENWLRDLSTETSKSFDLGNQGTC